MFEVTEKEGIAAVKQFKNSLGNLSKKLYKDPKILELYKKRHEFDLFITDANINEVNVYKLLTCCSMSRL